MSNEEILKIIDLTYPTWQKVDTTKVGYTNQRLKRIMLTMQQLEKSNEQV